MERGQHMDQLHELFKALHISISAPFFEITHKRSAVNRGKDLIIAPDHDRAFGVTSQLFKFARRFCTERTYPIRGSSNDVPLNLSARVSQKIKSLGVITKRDANILNDPIDLAFKLDDGFLIQGIEMGHFAIDEGGYRSQGRLRLSIAPTARTSCHSLHPLSL